MAPPPPSSFSSFFSSLALVLSAISQKSRRGVHAVFQPVAVLRAFLPSTEVSKFKRDARRARRTQSHAASVSLSLSRSPFLLVQDARSPSFFSPRVRATALTDRTNATPRHSRQSQRQPYRHGLDDRWRSLVRALTPGIFLLREARFAGCTMISVLLSPSLLSSDDYSSLLVVSHTRAPYVRPCVWGSRARAYSSRSAALDWR